MAAHPCTAPQAADKRVFQRPARMSSAMKKKKDDKPSPVIAQNRKARHDYFIEEKFEAGLALTGWEVKSLRAGRAQLKEGYVVVENGEAWLVGAHLSPLPQASTHVDTNPVR